MTAGFFDVRDDNDFFGILERVLASFKSTHAKRSKDLSGYIATCGPEATRAFNCVNATRPGGH